MNSFFRKLPLSVKLMLIGIIPVIFLIYLSGQLYNEKRQKVKLIADYIEHIHESQNIAKLMSELENERKYSYEYSLKKVKYGDVILQRPRTDALIAIIHKSKDFALFDFTEYTFLNRLPSIRSLIDSSNNYRADSIMRYYTTAIARLNTINSIASASNTFLQPVYKDLIAQKTLFEMFTYLGVLRTNIYSSLYTKKYRDSFTTSIRAHDFLKSYETEFLLKASPSSIKIYKDEKESTALKPTLAYIDSLLTRQKLDSAYTAEEWWDLSSKGAGVLKQQQLDLGDKIESGMNLIYKQELKSENKTLIFLIVAIILGVTFVIYTTKIISDMLTELKVALQRISVGKTGLQFYNMPDDVMGNLSKSILEIDKNNIQLAHAANAIGKGDFNVSINPRSDEDLLGNSIERMKEDLQQLTMQKDKVQEETLELMRKKDDFLSIASHELKTPVTSLKAYTQMLQMDSKEAKDDKREMMFSKMDLQIDKLTSLINNLLDTTKIQNGKLIYTKNVFYLNELVKEIVDEIQVGATAHQIIIENNTPVQIYADKERVAQVLSNLISNAIKYCPDCKRIIVNLKCKESIAICSVQDFGNGIQSDQKDKIFERFYRISGNNLHTYPGLGLGLYIAKEIIERHNGKIWFESEAGKGSTFFFTLPQYTNK